MAVGASLRLVEWDEQAHQERISDLEAVLQPFGGSKTGLRTHAEETSASGRRSVSASTVQRLLNPNDPSIGTRRSIQGVDRLIKSYLVVKLQRDPLDLNEFSFERSTDRRSSEAKARKQPHQTIDQVEAPADPPATETTNLHTTDEKEASNAAPGFDGSGVSWQTGGLAVAIGILAVLLVFTWTSQRNSQSEIAQLEAQISEWQIAEFEYDLSWRDAFAAKCIPLGSPEAEASDLVGVFDRVVPSGVRGNGPAQETEAIERAMSVGPALALLRAYDVGDIRPFAESIFSRHLRIWLHATTAEESLTRAEAFLLAGIDSEARVEIAAAIDSLTELDDVLPDGCQGWRVGLAPLLETEE